MMTKIIFSTSEQHTKKLIFEFFKRTSMPRIKEEYYKNKAKSQNKQ